MNNEEKQQEEQQHLPAQETDEVMVLCKPMSWSSPNTAGLEGVCAKCGCAEWVSDTSMNAMKQKDMLDKMKAYCVPCGLEDMGEDDEFIPMTGEQIAEIKEGIKDIKREK